MESQEKHDIDIIQTSAGDVEITFLGHGTLMMTFQGKTIHIDPFSRVADYASLPKADLLLLTHEHRDHLDPEALMHVRSPETKVVLSESCTAQVEGGIVMRNGDVRSVMGIEIEAVPAYNIVHKRESGEPFHPKGVGNGYVLTFGDTWIYVAGDTENIPEMGALENIDIAFLPMNLPYTMSPEMTADAARIINPRILYPYHFGNTDTLKIVALLKDREDMEVRIRRMA